MIKGFAAAALIGTFALGMAVIGVAIILPRLIAIQWRRRYVETRA